MVTRNSAEPRRSLVSGREHRTLPTTVGNPDGARLTSVVRPARLQSTVVEFTCPRCQSTVEARFYGPCESCRNQLRDSFGSEGRVIELAEYEPKVNVTPNAVALKDD